MPLRASIHTLRTFYVSIAFTLALLAILTQIFIQFVLYQGHLGRMEEGHITQSAVLSQQIQQDMLIQLIPNHNGNALKRLKAEVPAWEKDTALLYDSNTFPPADLGKLASAKSAFFTMEKAAEDLIVQEEAKTINKKAVTQDIYNYFISNQIFLPAAEKTLTDIVTRDDIQADSVHWTELTFCALTIITIGAELWFVARPAMKQLRKAEQDLLGMLDKATAKNPTPPPVP